MKYKVLKEWGDFKVDETVDTDASLTKEELDTLVSDGTLEEVQDEVQDAGQDGDAEIQAPLETAIPFSIVVEWIDGVTPEQQEAAQPMIKEAMEAMTEAYTSDPAAVLPESVKSLTFKRI